MLHLVGFALVIASCLAKNIVTDCGPSDAWIKFRTLDITPEPFNILGKINVSVDVETTKQIGDGVKLIMSVKKSNLDNGFIWEIPCTNIGIIGEAAQGIQGYLGSCEYRGSCDFPFIKTWVSSQTCPEFFKANNIPCACPFPPQKHSSTAPAEIDLSQFEDKMPKWLIEGGYEVKAELKNTKDNDKVVGCLQASFRVSARKACPAVLKRLNACPKD